MTQLGDPRHRHTQYYRWTLPPPPPGPASSTWLSKGAVYESDRRVMDKLSLAAAQYYKLDVPQGRKDRLLALLARE